MKEVMAIVRMNMMNQTKRALAEAGIPSITARDALGRGEGVVSFDLLKGAEHGYEEAIVQLGQSQRLVPKRVLIMILTDSLVDKAINAIIRVNRTGKSGDGKIYIMPCHDAIRVRTGESGDITLDEV